MQDPPEAEIPPLDIGEAAQPAHSPALALLLGALFPGGAQLYNGQGGKALCVLLALALCIAATHRLDLVTFGASSTAGPLLVIAWCLALVDGYVVGRRKQLGQAVGHWETL